MDNLVIRDVGKFPRNTPPVFPGSILWKSKTVCAGETCGKVENLGIPVADPLTRVTDACICNKIDALTMVTLS